MATHTFQVGKRKMAALVSTVVDKSSHLLKVNSQKINIKYSNDSLISKVNLKDHDCVNSCEYMH